MRIISGKHKGTTLYLANKKNTRSLKDSVRENIFNLLTHSNKINFQFEKSYILDLFAGTGAFGIECLSRHAKNVCFVEKAKDAIKILEKNIDKLKLKNRTNIFVNDVFSLIEKKNVFKSKFSLIFCDPPYKLENNKKLLETIFNKNLLNRNGIIILHRKKNNSEKLPYFFEIIDERIYGLSKITFGKILS